MEIFSILRFCAQIFELILKNEDGGGKEDKFLLWGQYRMSDDYMVVLGPNGKVVLTVSSVQIWCKFEQRSFSYPNWYVQTVMF